VCGHHSSGRSVSFSHFGIGNRVVRTLTAQSRTFFQTPPPGFSEVPLARRAPALFIAAPAMLPPLQDLHASMRPFAVGLREVAEGAPREIVPVLRTGGDAAVAGLLDPDGLKLDSDALLQGYARAARAAGAAIVQDFRVAHADRRSGHWSLVAECGVTLTATLLVHART
jgi:D-arginine dehydrogenase